MTGYLNTMDKAECFGCEACANACVRGAICFQEDEEGFRYPAIDVTKCVKCGQCHRACPCENPLPFYKTEKTAYGGAIRDAEVLRESTSGGAFSAVASAWCDKDYVVYGAEAEGLNVFHREIDNKKEIGRFRKSKYVQSNVGNCYRSVKQQLVNGKKVLFSGTPCQVAGLRGFLGAGVDRDQLLTVEVVCEGVPTPLFIKKFSEWLGNRIGGRVFSVDYRYKNRNKWDFQVMQASLERTDKTVFKWKQDRWFNPFWSIWLQHLMSRPSCYECPFARVERGADITLGDLWGVHLYCPELYNHNKGASLVIANTDKGRSVLEKAKDAMVGHELDFSTALKYQGPMRGHIKPNALRGEFMRDIQTMPYDRLCEKWSTKVNFRLLFSKYIWGNRQKVWFWNLFGRRRNSQ